MVALSIVQNEIDDETLCQTLVSFINQWYRVENKKQHGFTKTNPEKKWETRGLLYFIHTFLLINSLYYVTEENNVNLKVRYLIKLYTICIILHDTLARELTL